jgi:hypothetical protein
MVSLTKFPAQAPADAVPADELVKCPLCEQRYRIRSSADERNKFTGWLRLAERAIRGGHPAHAGDTVTLVWKFRLDRR